MKARGEKRGDRGRDTRSRCEDRGPGERRGKVKSGKKNRQNERRRKDRVR